MKKFKLISTGEQIQLTGDVRTHTISKDNVKFYHAAFVPCRRSDPKVNQTHLQWIGQDKFQEIKA